MTLEHGKICLFYGGDKNQFFYHFFTDSNIVKKRVRVIGQKMPTWKMVSQNVDLFLCSESRYQPYET